MKETDPGVKWFNTIYFPLKKTARASLYEEKILPRLRNEDVFLFTPWGPRYDWENRGSIIKETDTEIESIRYLSQLLAELKKGMPGKEFRWLFLGADLYGTKINNLPPEAVSNYFNSLKSWLYEILPDAKFQLWSEFDGKADNYRQKVAQNFNGYVDGNLLSRTAKTAHSMGSNSVPNTYIIERIAEAILIEETFRPIKISCVARHKDDKVDFELPRLYFLPNRLQTPWFPREGIRKI